MKTQRSSDRFIIFLILDTINQCFKQIYHCSLKFSILIVEVGFSALPPFLRSRPPKIGIGSRSLFNLGGNEIEQNKPDDRL